MSQAAEGIEGLSSAADPVVTETAVAVGPGVPEFDIGRELAEMAAGPEPSGAGLEDELVALKKQMAELESDPVDLGLEKQVRGDEEADSVSVYDDAAAADVETVYGDEADEEADSVSVYDDTAAADVETIYGDEADEEADPVDGGANDHLANALREIGGVDDATSDVLSEGNEPVSSEPAVLTRSSQPAALTRGSQSTTLARDNNSGGAAALLGKRLSVSPRVLTQAVNNGGERRMSSNPTVAQTLAQQSPQQLKLHLRRLLNLLRKVLAQIEQQQQVPQSQNPVARVNSLLGQVLAVQARLAATETAPYRTAAVVGGAATTPTAFAAMMRAQAVTPTARTLEATGAATAAVASTSTVAATAASTATSTVTEIASSPATETVTTAGETAVVSRNFAEATIADDVPAKADIPIKATMADLPTKVEVGGSTAFFGQIAKGPTMAMEDPLPVVAPAA